ncbi:MAG: PBECR2 nuclease fold domain-containing protein [Nitrincola lacisaponensis]|uniref:PBECR2 nuclease fold domain-containing protein n=1 Tax=Nitrincola lacisaponensis TaxID=267850 RepID=UPI00391AEEEC
MPSYGSRPFKEAISYFNQKLPLPTTGWQDVYGQQHDHAFMVAGANRMAIVEGFATAVQAAIERGETLADFRKRFDEIVSTQGWDYNGTRGWRSRLIYETNVRQAYNAGREAQMDDPEFRERFPYTEYRHSGAENFRPKHKAWDRLVLAADDPFWREHSPSNGHFCKCKKFPRSRRWLERTGRKVETAPADEYREFVDKRTGEVRQIPLGIDPGFEHRPGQSWLEHQTLKPTDWKDAIAKKTIDTIPYGPVSKPPLPRETPVSSRVLMDDGLPDERYVSAFLDEFNSTGPRTFKDVTGEPMMISDRLFKTTDGDYKALKDGVRHRYVRLLARTIQQPDEVWALLEPDSSTAGKYRVKRRYIKRWVLDEDGVEVHGFSAFEYGQGVWSGSTAFTPNRRRGKGRIPNRPLYMEDQREGVLLYRRADIEDGGV